MHGRPFEAYLLDISMFKPRLLVLRLSLAKKYDPNSDTFSNDHFNETNTTFSSESWREVSEQLLQTFSPRQVSNLKQLLTAWRSNFTLKELEQRANEANYHDPGVIDGFRSQSDIKLMLRALYETGAIGNRFTIVNNGKKSSRDRWSFRDYDEPAFDKRFYLHESLRKFFQVAYD